jgi:hypothetical protein
MPIRANIFAVKFSMLVPLSIDDLDRKLGRNTIKQFFYTTHDDEQDTHIMCFRVKDATTRTRIRTLLLQLEGERKLQRPRRVSSWLDTIYMGQELFNGVGAGIVRRIKTHMLANNHNFREYMNSGTLHQTNMLIDTLRSVEVEEAAGIVVAVVATAQEEENAAGIVVATAQDDNNAAAIVVDLPHVVHHMPVSFGMSEILRVARMVVPVLAALRDRRFHALEELVNQIQTELDALLPEEAAAAPALQ